MFDANEQDLIDAVKWTAARRVDVVLPNGRRLFLDWKDDPAHQEIFDPIESARQCNR